MKIIGALARGNSAPTIYFCEYCHSEIEKEAIKSMYSVLHTGTTWNK